MIKHGRHLGTRGKRRKHERQAVMISKENTAFQAQANTVKSSYINSDEYRLEAMVSIIFNHLEFWMRQQPSIPEGSLQVLVPSGHCCFSSGGEKLPEMPMKLFLLNSVSTCCGGFLQQNHVKRTRQHSLLSGHVLPSGHGLPHCNKDSVLDAYYSSI